MARKLIPHKLVVKFDKQGQVEDGIILYRIQVDGVLGKEFKSLGIKNIGFNKVQFNAALNKIRQHVKSVEKAED